MSDNLTALISRVQIQLLDDGTLFSTATVTAAIRSALGEWNAVAPVILADLIAVVDTQLTYELTGGDFTNVLDILDVLKNDDDGELDIPLDYDDFFEDNRPWIRLRQSESSGDLLIRFTQPHAINGLDAKVESTMTADQDQVLVDGACAHAIEIRLMKPIESINLNQASGITTAYERASVRYFAVFHAGMGRYASRKPPVSEKRATNWTLDA